MDVQPDQRKKRDKVEIGKHRWWIASYIALAVCCLAVYFLLQFRVFGSLGIYRSLIQRLALAGIVLAVVFSITTTLEHIVKKRSQKQKGSYNITRLIRFLSVVIAIIIAISLLFSKWYTAAVTLGLVSLILGFALQTPISSLIGWFYIVFNAFFNLTSQKKAPNL